MESNGVYMEMIEISQKSCNKRIKKRDRRLEVNTSAIIFFAECYHIRPFDSSKNENYKKCMQMREKKKQVKSCLCLDITAHRLHMSTKDTFLLRFCFSSQWKFALFVSDNLLLDR